jgi:hypothetical protein
MQVAPLAKRDQTFHNRPQFFGLGQCCHDLLVLDQGLSHVPEQHLAML